MNWNLYEKHSIIQVFQMAGKLCLLETHELHITKKLINAALKQEIENISN